MTIIEGIRDFLSSCPLLNDHRINVDYLPEDAGSGAAFSISAVSGTEVLRPYMGSSAECQYLFVLRSISSFGPDMEQTIAIHSFYAGIAAWLRRQSRARQLPQMPQGMTPRVLEAITGGYLLSQASGSAIYQIECRLLYERKGE